MITPVGPESARPSAASQRGPEAAVDADTDADTDAGRRVARTGAVEPGEGSGGPAEAAGPQSGVRETEAGKQTGTETPAQIENEAENEDGTGTGTEAGTGQPTEIVTWTGNEAEVEAETETSPSNPPGIPIEVSVAAGLMGVVVVLQLLVPIRTLLAGVPADRWGSVGLAVLQWFGFLTVYAFFGFSAYRGAHWARILLLVLAAVAVFGFLADTEERVFGFAAILHCVAVLMLFLPGSRSHFEPAGPALRGSRPS
ncbi:hypothetical protein FHR81_002519 [Actinoalloteichus hoggarensis]|uniref:Uncharacterized protein n=1 Tax=Actinoalloteichus hoggarensis TaxID=1470176 RepID=A0A221VX51_9PSEU|nr:hypothetical protein [Actinoalloteichus hoggarensis]ASO18122.1 hypothetical protein AHOG_02290 [Actinoalloteichus hoggarensis]MBB5921479.1 hypothetical protein [Actinoalloteichus hoggarensis]